MNNAVTSSILNSNPQLRQETTTLTIHLSEYISAAVRLLDTNQILFLRFEGEKMSYRLRSCVYINLDTGEKIFGASAENEAFDSLFTRHYGNFYFEYFESFHKICQYAENTENERQGTNLIVALLSYVVSKAQEMLRKELPTAVHFSSIRIWHPAHLSFSSSILRDFRTELEQTGCQADVSFCSDSTIYTSYALESGQDRESIVVLDWAQEMLRCSVISSAQSNADFIEIQGAGGKDLDAALCDYLHHHVCDGLCRFDEANLTELEQSRARLAAAQHKSITDALVLTLHRPVGKTGKLQAFEYRVTQNNAYGQIVQTAISEIEKKIQSLPKRHAVVTLYLSGELSQIPFIQEGVRELCNNLHIEHFAVMNDKDLIKRAIFLNTPGRQRFSVYSSAERPAHKAPEDRSPESVPAQSGSYYDSAIQLLNANRPEDVPTALAYLRVAANEQHDAKAVETLGLMLSDGKWEGKVVTEKSPSEAIKFLQISARHSPKAMNYLGMHYFEGAGVEKNDATAFSWFLRSAQKGYPAAKFNLYLSYENGEGVPPDQTKALYWLKQAAEKDHYAKAEYSLALKYEEGSSDIPQDEKKAFEWCKHAALQGNDAAQMLLGNYYERGVGVDVSYRRALGWYHKSAKASNADAYYCLGMLYENLAENNEEQQRYLRKRAITLYKTGADQGSAIAAGQLGYCYCEGIITEQNLELGIKYYEQAAQNGNALAQNNLGLLYQDGAEPFIRKDIERALALYGLAAEQGNEIAKNNFHSLNTKEYSDAERNELKAKAETGEVLSQKNYAYACLSLPAEKQAKYMIPQLFEYSAHAGHLPSAFLLGKCYASGIGGKVNLAKAEENLIKCIKQGNSAAMIELAKAYLENDMLNKRHAIIALLKKACDLNEPAAYTLLGMLYLDSNFEDTYDKDKGVQILRKAADKGDKLAQNILLTVERNSSDGDAQIGETNYMWEIGRADYIQAIKKDMQIKAEAGDSYSQFFLGINYLQEGTHTEQAINWLQNAADNGNINAMLILGAYYYLHQEEEENNIHKFLQLLEKAAEHRHIKAVEGLIEYYEDSNERLYNPEKAQYYRELLIQMEQNDSQDLTFITDEEALDS